MVRNELARKEAQVSMMDLLLNVMPRMALLVLLLRCVFSEVGIQSLVPSVFLQLLALFLLFLLFHDKVYQDIWHRWSYLQWFYQISGHLGL